jgi:tetratricopeptide (TPR) repeat protein
MKNRIFSYETRYEHAVIQMELTIDQALKKGVEAHKAGQVQEADRIYTAILKANPNHPDANHNMGILGVDVGKVEEALPFFKKALEVNSSIAQYWRSYIDALIKLDRVDDAKTVIDQAKSSGAERNGFDQLDKKLTEAREKPLSDGKTTLEENPQRPNVLDNLKLDQAIKLATKTSKEGSPEEAKRIYQDILAKFPKNKKAIEGLKRLSDRSLGKVSKAQDAPQKQLQTLIKLHGQGQYQRVLNEASKLLVGFPKSVNLYNIIGVTSKDLGKLDEAISAYTKALSIKPDFADGYYNMANAFQSQGKLDEAIEAYTKALSIKPDYAEAYSNMAVIFKDQDRLDEAIEAFNKAISIKPDYAEAFYNMGLALKYQGKLEEAISAYTKALSIKPDFAEAYNSTGMALKEQGNLKEAIEAYEKALLLKPDYAEAYSNMSFVKLLTSSWREGIELRKWRWHTQNHQIDKRSFSVPEWDGSEAAHDKTLLVWAEQGPGDVVIWSSCISHYANFFRRIIIECHPKLVDLLGRSLPNVLVRSLEDRSSDSSQDFDFQVPMETLFGYACLAGACTETQSSYLFPDPKRVKHWSTKLRNISSRKTVGLSWKSPLMTAQRANNYPSLSYWGSTLKKYRSKFTFVNLQSTDYRDDIAYFKEHFGCETVHFDQLDLYNDLSDVAALSQALDCSISVATAAASISAAVGTQTIIPTWKQGPWNNILFNSRGPAVDILLKNTSDSWGPVFEEVATKLKVLDAE